MRASALKYRILSVSTSLVALIILLMPFHAFLTVWGSNLVGHYTSLRLWKEVILIFLLAGVSYLLLTDTKIRSHTLTRRLVWLILIYCLVSVLWGVIALHFKAVTPKALGYGLISNLRFLAFFLASWALALRTSRLHNNWQRLILWPAAVVVTFGLLQILILPDNFLTHFGYGANTIAPYGTINHNDAFVRIQSTLRGANPLGAYLIIPTTTIVVILLKDKRRMTQIALLAASFATLFFSFSRSAWLGLIVSLGIVLGLSSRSFKMKKLTMGVGCIVLLAVMAVLLSLRHTSFAQNIFLHTEAKSTIKTTSDGGHTSAIKSGLYDLVHEPLGRGIGTAGPASIYNHGHQVRIAENYYVQIGQETGWIGLCLFILINVSVGYLLWLRRASTLALCLFASFVGLCVVNMLSHAWADDTLAYVWWGMAGIAMVNMKNSHDDKKSLK